MALVQFCIIKNCLSVIRGPDGFCTGGSGKITHSVGSLKSSAEKMKTVSRERLGLSLNPNKRQEYLLPSFSKADWEEVTFSFLPLEGELQYKETFKHAAESCFLEALQKWTDDSTRNAEITDTNCFGQTTH